MVLSVAEDNGHRFGHHCRWQTSANLIKLEASINKSISFFILLNLLIRFVGGLGTNMCKAAHPSGGLDSSNPRFVDDPAHDWTRDCVRATRYCGRTIEHAT